MNLQNRIEKLEREAVNNAPDSNIAVDFGLWLGVIEVSPVVLERIEKIYGEPSQGDGERLAA
jgi:hypothetical protein